MKGRYQDQKLSAIQQKLGQHKPKERKQDIAHSNDWDAIFNAAIDLLRAKERLAQHEQLRDDRAEGEMTQKQPQHVNWEFYQMAQQQLTSIKDFLEQDHITDRMRLEVAKNALKYAKGFLEIQPAGENLADKLATNQRISDLGRAFIRSSVKAMDPTLSEKSKKLFYSLLTGVFYIGAAVAATTAVPVLFGASAATVLTYSGGTGMALLIDYINRSLEKQRVQTQEAKTEMKEMKQVEQKVENAVPKKSSPRGPL